MKLVFIAGGIGATPFRSMVRYLLDKNEKRNIVMFHFNKKGEEIAFEGLFLEAAKRLTFTTVKTLTDPGLPADLDGERGFIDRATIEKYAPDFKKRTSYISGPQAMVAPFRALLLRMGLKRRRMD